MVIPNVFIPSEYIPILVQINYSNGSTTFLSARNDKDILFYSDGSNIVSIFRFKPKKNN
jgi:hypothetical protein